MSAEFWLDPIPHEFRGMALQGIDSGDVIGFLCRADNTASLDLVSQNIAPLRARGLYEEALVEAFIATRTNNRRWPARCLRTLVRVANRDRLRSLYPPPGAGLFTVYRGVAGVGDARRVRGLSWTGDRERAKWFARRYPSLPKPAVCTVNVDAEYLLAYVNKRKEDEYIVDLPREAKVCVQLLDGAPHG
jgi:hypothetical protein